MNEERTIGNLTKQILSPENDLFPSLSNLMSPQDCTSLIKEDLLSL